MKKILLSAFSFIVSLSVCGQLITDWQRNTGLQPYGDMRVKTDNANQSVVIRGLASGSGFIQLGTSMTKYDTAGNQLWSIVDENYSDDFGFGMKDFEFDSENNIIIGGIEMSPEDFYTHSMLIKLSPDGTELWRINLSPVLNWSESIENIAIGADGSIYAAATLYFDEVETLAQALVKISPEGEIEWTSFDNNQGFNGIALDDEGMLYTAGFDNIRKYNQTGEMIWSVPFSFSDGIYYSPANVTETIQIEGPFIRIPGYAYDSQTNENKVALISGNTDGNNFNFPVFDILSEQNNENTIIRDFCVDADGNTFISGNVSYGTSNPGIDILDAERGGKGGSSVTGLLIFAISASGENHWSYTEFAEEGTEPIFPIGSATGNPGLVVVCNNSNVNTSSELVYSFNRESGSINWTQTISNTPEFNSLYPQSMYISGDGSLYLTGNGVLPDESQSAYLNKYEFEQETVNVNGFIDGNPVSVFPNPASDVLTILHTNSYHTAQLTNSCGRLISEQRISGRNQIVLETHNLSSGLYHLILIGSQNTITKKFIKE